MQLVWLLCWQGVQKFVLLAARWMHLCPSTNEWHWWQVSSNAWSSAARDPPPSRTTFDDCSLVPCINSCWWCWRWRASFSADDDPPSTRLELAAISDSNNNKPIADINDFDAIFLHENTLFLTLSSHSLRRLPTLCYDPLRLRDSRVCALDIYVLII